MATSLDQAIQEWWKATPALEALIPSQMVSTEIRQSEADDVLDDLEDDEEDDAAAITEDRFDDCVTLDIVTRPLWRSSSGVGYQSDVVLSVMSSSYDTAKDVIKAVRTWDNGSFTGGGNKITMCRLGEEEAQQDETDGVWTVSTNLTMNHRSA